MAFITIYLCFLHVVVDLLPSPILQYACFLDIRDYRPAPGRCRCFCVSVTRPLIAPHHSECSYEWSSNSLVQALCVLYLKIAIPSAVLKAVLGRPLYYYSSYFDQLNYMSMRSLCFLRGLYNALFASQLLTMWLASTVHDCELDLEF